MAGSYNHCDDDETGEFRFGLIENMGDAHEACHHMFWMIRYLANNDKRLIEKASNAYYAAGRRQKTFLPDLPKTRK